MEILQSNPDLSPINSEAFILKQENLPKHLWPLLRGYTFRKCTIEEIENSITVTNDAWPGLPESTNLDLRGREITNSPMCGVFDKLDNMVGYTRLIWGFDNQGKPELHSHMTAVKNDIRNSGVGEALKWLARQVALEFPAIPVTQLTVTFDNLQGRNCYVNFNKLGVVCGCAGGYFKENAYGLLTGQQHKGNPTDRFVARWQLDSKWTLAHLQERVANFSLDQIRSLPTAMPTLSEFNSDLCNPYITMPIPLNWDSLLADGNKDNYELANKWRTTTRMVIQNYHAKGYTTIGQIKDEDHSVNLQIMALHFNPYEPPQELLCDSVTTDG